MFKEEKFQSSHEQNIYPEIDPAANNKFRFSRILQRLHFVNGLYLISAILQILMGVAVVILSLTNAIQPHWIATFLTVLGSISIVSGCYFMYSLCSKSGAFDSLLQSAIKRVINFQN